ncbi:hypothetical protein B296_00033208 [Ensete ventricosum]|uniref:Uncharacterized protein n=1 Tax=Ensete ventricosum TaxID=4639 RepID=A0A426X6Z6_ENSVE|nr:hypothetical protein B296_00033208 [Ensete ventricosum]
MIVVLQEGNDSSGWKSRRKQRRGLERATAAIGKEEAVVVMRVRTAFKEVDEGLVLVEAARKRRRQWSVAAGDQSW